MNSSFQRDSPRMQLFGNLAERKPKPKSNLASDGAAVGGQTDNSGRSSPYVQKREFDYTQSTLSQLESQSEQQISQMSQKIKALKSLSLRMGDEIRNGSKTLEDLESTFGSTSAKLKTTFGNMMKMAKRSKISIKTWLIIFFVVGLFFFWVWIT